MNIGQFIEQLMQYGLEYFKVYHGEYRGIVTRNDDPETRGRIQVRVPQVGHNAAPDIWVKPAMQGAGVNRGMFWPPEVGDTVFVSFALGQPGRPECYWGGWYSAPGDTSSVPTEFAYTNDKPETRGFVTRLGHLLKFSDESGNEQILLQWHRSDSGDEAVSKPEVTADRTTGDTASILMKPDGSIEIKDINKSTILLDGDNKKIEVTDVNANKVTLDENGVIVLDKSENKITMSDAGVQVDDKNGNSAIMNSGGVELKSNTVKVGDGADSPAMRHKDWETWAKTHTHPTSVGPSGPPVQPPTPTIASQVVTVK